MRRLNVVSRKKALQVLKEIDAFPKIPDSYKESTVSGGGISIIVFAAIIILVVSEVRYFAATEMKYYYDVDSDFEGKLKINIDMTVAMPCNTIGADVLDLTGQNINTFGRLEETDVFFEMSHKQKSYFEMIQKVNQYVKKEYHALHDVLWTTGYGMLSQNMPEREDKPEGKPTGCRLKGTLTVNKVAGNFHVTAGKGSMQGGRHLHDVTAVLRKSYNFSHRISTFSFGNYVTGVVNPLDGEEKITHNNYHMFQYFMQIVPTSVHTYRDKLDTFMYAVTEKNRSINHSEGSHGVPGIFVKYDMSPLKVTVKEEHRPYWKFQVRMCGIVGGIFATSGLLHQLMGVFVDCVCCRFKLGQYSVQKSNSISFQAANGETSKLLPTEKELLHSAGDISPNTGPTLLDSSPQSNSEVTFSLQAPNRDINVQ